MQRFQEQATVLEEKILDALRSVIDPKTKRDVVSAGLISGIVARGGKVGFMITIAPGDRSLQESLQEECRKAVVKIPGVESVTAVLTGEASPHEPPKEQRRGMAQWNLAPVEGVKRIIAVASGKGGVGKSTTTVNLAHAAAALGLRVGILDADIYGPSMPRMLGLRGKKPEVQQNKFVPLTKDNIQAMSIGFLTGDDAAVLRGPMITKTLVQLLRGTAWQDVDILFIDLPPGTGDIHLSLVQQTPLALNQGGVILVTTPQDVAVDDARKCAQMFGKVDVPILGVIENMSWFEDTSGQKHYLFGRGGGKKLADESGATLLGQIPQRLDIQQAMEAGENNAQALYKPIITKLI
ncbi:MAG: Mrp/NBP35 family ATP-binding protein [Rickettsiales bacterium]